MTSWEEAVCRFCGWEGTAATREDHFSLFCPVCCKPADYLLVVDELKRQGLWKG